MAHFLRANRHDTEAFSFLELSIMKRVQRRVRRALDVMRHCCRTVRFDLRTGFARSGAKLKRVPVLMVDAREALGEVRRTVDLLADDPRIVFGTSTDHDC